MLKANTKKIIEEISFVLSTIDERQVSTLVSAILEARRIVVHGAGRVGLACRGFAMRLGHLGFAASTLADSTVPSIGVGDILLLASGSGETQTVYDIAVLGKENGAHLALITGRPESRIGKLADTMVVIKAPSKVQTNELFVSVQPMTTLNEQCLQIFFDALVLVLMERTDQTQENLWARHSNLE